MLDEHKLFFKSRFYFVLAEDSNNKRGFPICINVKVQLYVKPGCYCKSKKKHVVFNP